MIVERSPYADLPGGTWRQTSDGTWFWARDRVETERVQEPTPERALDLRIDPRGPGAHRRIGKVGPRGSVTRLRP